MLRVVNVTVRSLIAFALLLAPQADCALAASGEMAPHAHTTGETCHDEAPSKESGHTGHDSGAEDADCTFAHGCPGITAIAATSIGQMTLPMFGEAPHVTPQSHASVTLAPDRRPPKG